VRPSDTQKTCPQCGAPTTLEICPYCGAKTDLDTAHANMEYPVIDCKEATIGFWTVLFPGIFAFTFSWFGICMPIFFFLNGDAQDLSDKVIIVLFSLLFTVIGIGATVVMLRPIIAFIWLKIHGIKITGTVYGYLDDNVILNGLPAQIVKILVHTRKGPRFLLYQLGQTGQPYGVGKKINLLVYKDLFLITKDSAEYDNLW